MNLWEVSEKSEKLYFADFEIFGIFPLVIYEFLNQKFKGGPFQYLQNQVSLISLKLATDSYITKILSQPKF